MKKTNNKGITILALIIWVLIIGAAILYAPKAYHFVIEQTTIRLITSNVEKAETEIRSELINTHPVHLWNRMDNLIRGLSLINPITKEIQTKNGWNKPGEVIITFDGINLFRLDGIGPDGSSLRLNVLVQRN